ncbi:G-type lectin S-receptor-like serine/threonine-protein kinase LECRK3 [Solanum dulcamara]|uniref:G-type lectin S-receptor-like serine/threonine-protein kinase LECRK3 n=1 Tax=Solanum dulcamara TaxID=45834 RepID=UPI0024853422|nr:G-type lectin S-receptor-like serine/threonine-protein kinase LECRK3 [Solanum dulcamara]
MAVLLWLLILCAFLAVALAQQRQFNITLGSSLTPNTNSSWFSPSRRFAFGFYEQTNGFAVGISIVGMPKKTAVWTANRNSPVVSSNAVLLLTNDGRLIVQVGGREISVTDSPGQAIASASMLDTGNFVLYNSDHDVIWQSFDNPTNTLLPGQHISAGQELFSSASEADDSFGIFRLKMQGDGNLVQYPVNTPDTAPYAYYSSGTDGVGNNVTLNLDDDGHLYLLNSTKSLRNITRGGYPRKSTIIYMMKIDADGILRVYSHSLNQQNSSAIWSSTNDRCIPKGLCGLNGYCTNIDDQVKCLCLPGFDFVMPGNWTAGCERNFTAETCRLKENTSKYYAMRPVVNTGWEDSTYVTLDTTTKEDCEQACLQDCNCEAAFFNDNKCRKQRLPLRYGRRDMGNSNIALVKVGINVLADEALPNQIEETKGKKLRIDILIAGITLAVFALLVLGISGFLIHRNHVWTYRKIQESRSVQLFEDVAPRAFSYAELEQATSGFKEALGRGAFGTVFKGILAEDQKVIAVKRLDKELVEGETEFQTEMKIIGRTHHRNLVRLLGYCLDGSSRLLVYEYMSNGSLTDVLFTPEKKPTWEERCGFARDIARGLLYLHDECDTQIIHCDIKPQNILMDDQFCAKISDFGMAKLLKKDQTRTYTGIRGTRGYVAPEWHRNLPVTVKADVYSFGVVLMELICRRKCVDWSLDENESILEYWVYNCFDTGELDKLVGDEEVDRRQFERMVKISIWCIQDEPSLRPSMKKVLLMLEGTVDIPVPPSPTSFLSAI